MNELPVELLGHIFIWLSGKETCANFLEYCSEIFGADISGCISARQRLFGECGMMHWSRNCWPLFIRTCGIEPDHIKHFLSIGINPENLHDTEFTVFLLYNEAIPALEYLIEEHKLEIDIQGGLIEDLLLDGKFRSFQLLNKHCALAHGMESYLYRRIFEKIDDMAILKILFKDISLEHILARKIHKEMGLSGNVMGMKFMIEKYSMLADHFSTWFHLGIINYSVSMIQLIMTTFPLHNFEIYDIGNDIRIACINGYVEHFNYLRELSGKNTHGFDRLNNYPGYQSMFLMRADIGFYQTSHATYQI